MSMLKMAQSCVHMTCYFLIALIIGRGRFWMLKDFCGGLVSVFPRTATVESNFCTINYEKNDHRSDLTWNMVVGCALEVTLK